MGFFGMGMQGGVLDGLRLGHKISQDKFQNERQIGADRRADIAAQGIHAQRQRQLEVSKNEMDSRNYERIVQSLMTGNLNEKQAEMMKDISSRMPFADLETLLSPRVDAAIGVARSVSSPDDFQDPAKKAAVNYVLSMGRDPQKFEQVEVDSKNPQVLQATTRDGETKEISTEQYSRHLDTIDSMRKALRTPQAQEQIKKYADVLFGKDQARKTLRKIYDEDTGREQMAVFDPAAGEITPVGGVKAITKGRAPAASASGQRDQNKLFDIVLKSLKDTEAYNSADPQDQLTMIRQRLMAFQGKEPEITVDSGGQDENFLRDAFGAIKKGADPKAVLARAESINPKLSAMLEEKLKEVGAITNKYTERYQRAKPQSDKAKLAELAKTDTISAVEALIKPYLKSGEVLPPSLARAQINRLKAYADDEQAKEMIGFLSDFLSP